MDATQLKAKELMDAAQAEYDKTLQEINKQAIAILGPIQARIDAFKALLPDEPEAPTSES